MDQVNDRLHILEGLLIVFLDLDKVIKIIRNSDDKQDLISQFSITEIQAQCNFRNKTATIGSVEQIKLETEQAELVNEQSEA